MTGIHIAYENIENVLLQRIKPPEGRRPLNKAVVEELMESIERVGLLCPIILKETESGWLELIAGAHRLEAVLELGYWEIDAIVFPPEMTVDRIAIEIDENLCRAELGPAERAVAMARRRELYQEQHPETKEHVAGAVATNAKTAAANFAAVPAFDKKMADVTGVSERAVRLDAQRGEALGAKDAARCACTCLDKGIEIDALIKLDPETRERLINQAARGMIVSARQPEMPPITPPVEPEPKPARPKLSEEEREKVKAGKLEADFWKLLAKMSPEMRERLINTAMTANNQAVGLAA